MSRPMESAWANYVATHPFSGKSLGVRQIFEAGFKAGIQHVTDRRQALTEEISRTLESKQSAELYERVESRYRAEHPEFHPSDIQVGEKVLPTIVPPITGITTETLGTVVDVREHGASITVAWGNERSLLQNLNVGSVRRVERQ